MRGSQGVVWSRGEWSCFLKKVTSPSTRTLRDRVPKRGDMSRAQQGKGVTNGLDAEKKGQIGNAGKGAGRGGLGKRQ